MEKLICVSGDLSLDRLELTKSDEDILINEVNIIFHCAASIRLEEPLKDSINNNVIGTLRLLQLAEKMKNLQVFSYMSTAYSQSYQLDLEEKYYPTNIDVMDFIEKSQTLDPKAFDDLGKKM